MLNLTPSEQHAAARCQPLRHADIRPAKHEAAGAFFRRGYADASAGRTPLLSWSRGFIAHHYGMGYFHGRAHRDR